MKVSSGTVHKLPDDLKRALTASPKAFALWEDITPLARNEWICWTVSVKKEETRKAHVRIAISKMLTGMRRPCCWVGCTHRNDKTLSSSQKFVLDKVSRK